MAQIEGGVVDALAGGVGPEIEGVAGSAAFEAVEGVLFQVDGEAATRAGRRAVQRAWAALLAHRGLLRGVEAEQVGRTAEHRDGGAHGGEVDGRV